MRFSIILGIDKPEINKDKNRIFLSIIKHQLSKYEPELYKDLYESGEPLEKDFSFAFYMADCKFHRETIEIPNQEIIVNFSCYDLALGIQIYNTMMKSIKQPYSYKDNKIWIKQVKLLKEHTITEERQIFISQSPCVAREHNHDNAKTWYHSLSTPEGQSQFLTNLKAQAKTKFPDKEKDVEQLQVKLLNNKEVKVKHYGIEVLGNIATFELSGKTYLLDYFYKAGAGSLKSGGFGLLKK